MQNKKRILIITGGDSNVEEVLDLTIPSKIKYAKKYGYDFMAIRSFKPVPEYNIDSSLIGLGFARTVSLFQMIELYDAIMWIDADSIITNDKYKIEDIIESNHTMYFSFDWPYSSKNQHSNFSGGNFIMQKTNTIDELFAVFLEYSQRFLNDVGSDQTCFNVIYKQTHLKDQFKILEHNYLNSVPKCLENTNTWISDPNRTGPMAQNKIISPWTEDSFIAHLTGITNEERIEIINKHFIKYI
jgi:hypothetical protein